ncbi:hypothetical protein GGF46_000194 [Coemansia sp. RSA 552]|nr:hypothetical protein GGF46_000194 [Coemansia sp. RSA 552]
MSTAIPTAGQHFSSGSVLSRAAVGEPQLAGFDLDEYLGEYQGYAKIRRAIFVGEHCPALSVAAYTAALAEVEARTADSGLHMHLRKILGQIGEAVDDAGGEQWEQEANRDSRAEEADVKGALQRAAKHVSKQESLRAQRRYVELLQRRGLVEESIRALQDARGFCTDVAEQAELHMDAARAALVLGRWMQVTTFVQRAEGAVAEPDPALAAELQLLRGLAAFGERRWAAAVAELAGLSAERLEAAGVFGRGVVSPRDVALYGTLAGLAGLGRDQTKAQLIDNVLFGQFLDHMPQCQQLLQSFYGARYGEALGRLRMVLSFCDIDPVLSRLSSALEQLIVDNAVVLYVRPFESVRIESMARALRFDSSSVLESTLVRMIDGGQIQARIDGTTGFLAKHRADPRGSALEQADKIHAAYMQQADLMQARIQYLEEEASSTGRAFAKK